MLRCYPLGILLANVRVVRGDVPNLVTERESKLRFVVHQPHQLTGHVNIAAGNRKGVFDCRIERSEVERLARVCDPGKGADTVSDRAT